MDLIILANTLENKANNYSLKRIEEEARTLNIDLLYINPFKNGLAILKKSKELSNISILHRVSSVHYDDIDLMVHKSLTHQGAKGFNSLSSLQGVRDKVMVNIELAQYFPENFIPCFSQRGAKLDNEKFQEFNLQCKESFKSFNGFILKPQRGMQGIGINYINSLKEINSWLETFFYLKDEKFFMQPRIPSTNEYRAIFIDGEVKCLIKKTHNSSDEFNKANFHQVKGSSSVKCSSNENKEIEKLTISLADHFNLFYGAIDFIEYEGKPFVLDINPVCGFEQAEKVTSLNIVGSLLVAIKSST
jgi:hypothetical protein